MKGGARLAYQAVFKRYELKYLLTRQQQQSILAAMESHMAPDAYGITTIHNLYFDTDNYRLIRRSIEKPAYKEKLRLRSYAPAAEDTPVFVELKKKYRHVVYKRRISLPLQDAADWLAGHRPAPQDDQISREIQYFRDYYGDLRPTVFLSYDRQAFYSIDDHGFRVTFDENILARRDDLSLSARIGGTPLLPEDYVLMEVKCAGGIPLWMTQVLTREQIRKTSFSKYGTAYQTMIFPNKEAIFYV